MRLVFFNRFYAPDHSATAQILTDLAEHLADVGSDVTVVTSRAIYGQEEGLLAAHEQRAGVTIIRTWTPLRRRGMSGRFGAYLAYYATSFVVALRLGGRDAVFVVKTDPPLLSVPLALAALLRGTQLVHWIQDLYPEIAAAYGFRGARALGALFTPFRDWSFRRARRVVPIGELMSARVVAMGVPQHRIATIPNWTNDAQISPSEQPSADLRRDWRIAGDAFVLAYSGNLGRAHEYDTLLGAAELLRPRPDVVFLFIGGGHMSEQLAARVAERGLGSFRFVPYQPRERLSESLGVGDAHWVSLKPEFEGLIVPSKVFGICAAARPVIAICAADGELPRLLSPDQSCVTVVPGDAAGLARTIVALAADRRRRTAIGTAARMVLEQDYSKARAFDRWRSLLDGLAGDGAMAARGRSAPQASEERQ